MKRTINVILSICMILPMILSNVNAEELPFNDVPSNSWYYSGVQYVYDNGIMEGTGKGVFSPAMTTTRGMIVTVLHSMEGKPKVTGNVFSDVDPSRYYAQAVNWANRQDIVAGYGNHHFGPNDNITREQLVAILYKYVKYKNISINNRKDLGSFKDISAVSSYAVDPMKWAVGNGLVSGMPGNLLAPKENATRAQIATVFMKLSENVLEEAHSDRDNDEKDYQDKADDKDNNGSNEKNGDDSSDNTRSFVVTFKDYDGTVLKTETVSEGNEAAPPEQPRREGYAFSSWEGNYQNVMKDETVTATYRKSTDDNVFSIESARIKKGETATIMMRLGGNVNLVDYDMELAYDESVLEIVSVDYKNKMADIANVKDGKILLNYAGVQNTSAEAEVLSITVKVKDNADVSETEIVFANVKFVDYLDSNGKFQPAPYNVVPSVISIQ